MYEYVFLALAGLVAGIINTVAGSGSALTLAALSFAGLPTGLANGTNRVGILLQTLVGYRALRQGSSIRLRDFYWLIVPTLFGAIIGAQVAIYLGKQSEIWLNRSIGLTMVMMLFLVLRNPQKWLKSPDEAPNLSYKKKIGLIIGFLCVGFYGGFVQAGVGVIMLVVLVSLGGYDVRSANSLKLLLTFLLNIPAFLIFLYEGQIDWWAGLTLALSQSLGTWVSVYFITTHPRANYWIRLALILILVWSIIHFLGLRAWAWQVFA
jgi:uncharacterized protein